MRKENNSGRIFEDLRTMNIKKFTELYGKYGPSQNQFELISLLDWMEGYFSEVKPKVLIELGVFRGGTFGFWDELIPKEDRLLIGVDLNDRGLMYGLEQKYSSDKTIKFVVGHSSGSDIAVEKTKKILGGRSADILFIDANHTIENVTQDYQRYAPFVRKGGLIIFHDIVGPELLDCTQVWMLWRQIIYNDQKSYSGYCEFFGGVNPCGIGVLVKC
jgi:cephalosporin hydroxylase